MRCLPGARVCDPVMSASRPWPWNLPLNFEIDALYFSTLDSPPLASMAVAMMDLTSPPVFFGRALSAARTGVVPASSRAARPHTKTNRNIGDLSSRNKERANLLLFRRQLGGI